MSGYIGATAVGLTTTAADVQGDITSTDTTPELILKNTTETDADGGRDGKITFKGEQSGGEESTLAQIQASHDGTADDQKGDLIFKTNDGSDGASPTQRMKIDSAGQVTITRADNGTHLVLESTDADASVGPVLDLHRNSSTPADSDTIGEIAFKGQNDANETLSYAFIKGFISDASDGTEDGQLNVNTMIGGTTRQRIKMDSTATVFNEEGRDIDFRVESDTHASAFLVDASTGGIEMNTSESNVGLFVNNTAHDSIVSIQAPNNKNSTIRFADGDDADVGMVDYDHASNRLGLTVNTAEQAGITSDGVFQMKQLGLQHNGIGSDTVMLTTTKSSTSSPLNFDFIVDVDTSSWTPLGFFIHVTSVNSGLQRVRSAHFFVRGATFNGSLSGAGVAASGGDTSDVSVAISDQGGTDPMTVRVAITHPNNRCNATIQAMGHMGIQRCD